MSHTFRRDPDASPFAERRAQFKRADKRDRFEERAQARASSWRAMALADLDTRHTPD